MNTTPLSLLERIRDNHDQDAWREFDAIYRPVLLRYARACGASRQDLDDIVQSCMAAIHEHIRSFEHDAGIGRFRAWLRLMVLNRVRNQLARKRPLATDPADLARSEDDGPVPEDDFDRIWWAEHLRYYLALVRGRVEPRSFDAFCAHVIQQRSVDEVCALYGLNANALYKIKWRVTQMLREYMTRLIDDDG